MRELFLRALAEILQRGFVLQHARKDFEVRNPAREGVRHGLKDIDRDWLFIGLMTLGGVAISTGGDFALHPLMLGGRRCVVDDEVHNTVRADVAQAGTEDDREILSSWMALCSAG